MSKKEFNEDEVDSVLEGNSDEQLFSDTTIQLMEELDSLVDALKSMKDEKKKEESDKRFDKILKVIQATAGPSVFLVLGLLSMKLEKDGYIVPAILKEIIHKITFKDR